jgi:AcrR family transcriptional regulator
MPDRYATTRSYGGRSASERASERRDRFIDAAIRCFGTEGYAATGVKDLCREAGLTDRYFYESFRDRSDLYVAAFDRVVGELVAVVGLAALAHPSEPEHQARAAVQAFVGALTSDASRARLLFLEVGAVGGEAARHARASTRRFADLVIAAARPHLAPDISEQRLAMAGLSLIGAMGLVMVEWLDGDLDVTVDDVVTHFLDLLLAANAAAPTPPTSA